MTPDYWTKATRHLSKQCPTMKQLIKQYKGESLTARGHGFYTLLRSVVGQQISVKAADAVWAKLEKTVKPLTPKKLLSLTDEQLLACGLSRSKVLYARNVAEFYIERRIILPSSPLEGERDLPLQIRGGKSSPQFTPHRRAEGARRLPLKGGVGEFAASQEGAYWSQFSDDEIIEQLIAIKGIGSWTAEMFLIFHLMRPDVFPVKDLGVLKAIHVHYPESLPKPASKRARNGSDAAQKSAPKWHKPAEYHAIAARFAPYRTVATWYLWRSLDPVPVAY